MVVFSWYALVSCLIAQGGMVLGRIYCPLTFRLATILGAWFAGARGVSIRGSSAHPAVPGEGGQPAPKCQAGVHHHDDCAPG